MQQEEDCIRKKKKIDMVPQLEHDGNQQSNIVSIHQQRGSYLRSSSSTAVASSIQFNRSSRSSSMGCCLASVSLHTRTEARKKDAAVVSETDEETASKGLRR